ncbi:hypothetical protein [Micromonospora profundi]|uniref:hypothetical protein n=1 Tax=Micromonospora profundi TaxID=1420889 RepID=UPI00365A9870
MVGDGTGAPASADRPSRWQSSSPLPPPGHLRTLSLATLANTVGTGLWVTGAALYLTRVVGLSPAQVGLGLTFAGLVGLTASVPLGGLADRRDPRTLRAVLQLAQAAVAVAYLLVGSFPVRPGPRRRPGSADACGARRRCARLAGRRRALRRGGPGQPGTDPVGVGHPPVV